MTDRAGRGARRIGRREFLTLSACLATLGCSDLLDPSARNRNAPPVPVRVRGSVLSVTGKGIGSVAVTDGLTVTPTSDDGSFDFVSSSARPYVYISIPDGYAVPTNDLGTARFFQPLGHDRGRDEVDVSFELVALHESLDTHSMVLLADPQFADFSDLARFRQETLPDLVSMSAGRQEHEMLALTCGDTVFDRLYLFSAYEHALRELAMPVLYAVGNHDLTGSAPTDPLAKDSFRQHFGPTYYSFNRGTLHYIVLDNVFWYGDGYIGYVSEEQLEWLIADLKLVEAGRTVVVCQHIPMLGTRHIRDGRTLPYPVLSVANRDDIYRILEPYQVHVLTAHGHETEHLLGDRVQEHENGAVCGGWWTGPICGDGTPNGYVVYEARGSELRWRYKATGRAAHEQMTVHGPGSDPEAPEDIVANVWFWDPEWTVRWYADGQPQGLMSRRTGIDPLARQLYDGPRRPSRYGWVDPYPTDHLFRASPGPGVSRVTVEATDRFGEVYTADAWLA